MNDLENKIIVTAIDGLEKQDYKVALEKILMLVTSSTKQIAYTKALDLRAKEVGAVTINDINLKEWKNSHEGDVCFIVATGPSLTFEDLDSLALV